MKATLQTETRTWILCPSCNERISTVDHLLNEKILHAGPWYCDGNKGCGLGWLLDRESADDAICVRPFYAYVGAERSKQQQRRVEKWIVLERGDMRVLVAGHWIEPEDCDAEEREERTRYFYEESTCPTNWFRDVAEMAASEPGGTEIRTDPHGAFSYVRTLEAVGGKCEQDATPEGWWK